MRLFLGIWPSTAAGTALAEAAEQLRRKSPPKSLRLTPAGQIHLTLRFLGEVPDDEAERLAAAIRDGVRTRIAPRMELGAPGAFPRPERPRVLWVGLRRIPQELDALHQAVDRIVARFPAIPSEDHPFHPHFTLARVNPVAPADLRTIGEAIRHLRMPSAEPWSASEIRLERSRLGPSGAAYETFASMPLLTTL